MALGGMPPPPRPRRPPRVLARGKARRRATWWMGVVAAALVVSVATALALVGGAPAAATMKLFPSGTGVVNLALKDFEGTRLKVETLKRARPRTKATTTTPPDFIAKPDSAIVNFHSSSCGHCQKHAATWRGVAAALSASAASRVLVGAVDCDVHRDLCTSFGVGETVPDIRPFGARGELLANKTLPEAYDDVLDAVDLTLHHHVSFSARQRARKVVHAEEGHTQKPPSLLPPKARVLRDMETAIRYALETGVFLGRKELIGDALATLRNWLVLLSLTFPTEMGRWKLDWLRRQVEARSTAGDVASLNSATLDALLEGWDFGRRSGESWEHCSDELGFPCGLWMVFHTVSVAVMRGVELPPELPAAHAIIHSFIDHFFSCSECRENFLKANPRPPHVERTGPTFALWLWREHNSVNVRLGHPRFPLIEACRACYVTPTTPGNSDFEESVVARFLASAYAFEPDVVDPAKAMWADVHGPVAVESALSAVPGASGGSGLQLPLPLPLSHGVRWGRPLLFSLEFLQLACLLGTCVVVVARRLSRQKRGGGSRTSNGVVLGSVGSNGMVNGRSSPVGWFGWVWGGSTAANRGVHKKKALRV